MKETPTTSLPGTDDNDAMNTENCDIETTKSILGSLNMMMDQFWIQLMLILGVLYISALLVTVDANKLKERRIHDVTNEKICDFGYKRLHDGTVKRSFLNYTDYNNTTASSISAWSHETELTEPVINTTGGAANFNATEEIRLPGNVKETRKGPVMTAASMEPKTTSSSIVPTAETTRPTSSAPSATQSTLTNRETNFETKRPTSSAPSATQSTLTNRETNFETKRPTSSAPSATQSSLTNRETNFETKRPTSSVPSATQSTLAPTQIPSTQPQLTQSGVGSASTSTDAVTKTTPTIQSSPKTTTTTTTTAIDTTVSVGPSGLSTAPDQLTTDRQPTSGITTGTPGTTEARYITSTTDWRSKPETTSPAATTTSVSIKPNDLRTTTKTVSTSPEFCEKPCPDDFFESAQGCLWLYSVTRAYATGLGNCQAIPNGDMISELDIEANFDGIQALMAYFKFPSHNFYVNGFMGDLNRKEKKARVVYISATTSLLTRNVTTVPRGEDQKDIGTICKDAPYIEFDTPLPNPPLQYLEPVKYRCKDQEVSTTRWDAYCTDRGVIGPAASLYNPSCAPSAKPKPIPPPDFIREELIPNLKCGQCFGMGTERCETGEKGQPDKCICKEGWSMQTCWRLPKFCPNSTCPFESHCEERVDHAVCVCDTDRCEVEMRALNRSAEMKFLDTATMIAGPTFEFIVKMIMQVLTPDRGETIQDSIQFYRSQFVSCSGIFYAFGGAPQAMKLDIAERRAMSIMFHLPQILVHILYALEVKHIDAVRAGRSDNLWKSSGKDKNRWDYGWTYCSTIILGSAFSMAIWYFNWNTHQKAYTSLGIADV
ncbi:hypothetical protein PRIPAC_91029 [Pristionchus pacificus]|uniref:Uncharacterized protein n=1 Tax=Pristionchus pacificus TaxID=54126 RepID=A0A2A6B5M6_PRIPA|nr:hypothetical protein PRIPAC_91029 [Pristionchus pacificus]|eukprot:PDM61163.1 hypothetical protein PRIPAC_50605 [Pristionchus pacificus]